MRLIERRALLADSDEPSGLPLSRSMNSILLFAALCVVAVLPGGGARAQVPAHWFPLDVGNAWYRYDPYTFHGFHARWVDQIVADTVVEGRRWARMERVWYGGDDPEQAGTPPPQWYRFTADGYLVRVAGRDGLAAQARVDTLHAYPGASVFTVGVGSTVVGAPGEGGCGTATARVTPFYPPGLGVSDEGEPGSPADSTHLALLVESGHAPCAVRYIYNIGPAEHLVAARVSGRHWGDESLLSVVLAAESSATPEKLHLHVAPSPATGPVEVTVVRATGGPLRLDVFDVLGRHVVTLHDGWAASASRHTWRARGAAAGVYVVQLRAGTQAATRLVTLAR